jgi:tetratricopeptide (TPR) repeat protein
MHSFGLEESGMYASAEEAGRLAIELNKNDLWAAHAVAHVMQMQARYLEGIDWLNALLPGWTRANNFIYHLYWHKALFHIGLSDHVSALAVYDTFLVQPLADDFYLDVCNASSLLWRLEMHGIDVGERWQALESYSVARIQDDELVFVSLHYLMTPARLQNSTVNQQALRHFETWAGLETTQGSVAKRVGLPLARAMISLGKGEYQLAASTIALIQNDIVNIGGSHAQRHLFEQMKSFAQQQT